ncbi:hypothetical protein NC651_027214 [Populus alba x Populus x berolinensis]|nr:hypothetical protein NC651_027214 [Populus alba x Populus x berolinensis]
MVEIDGTNGNGNHGGVVLDIKDNFPSSSSIKKVCLEFLCLSCKRCCKIHLFPVPVFSPCYMKNLVDGIRFPGFLPKKPDLTEPVWSGLNRFSVRFG